jgi:hypothetical protein
VLEGALDLATARLEPAVDLAAAAIARVRTSPIVARARAEATAEVRYYIDELSQRLDALEQLFGVGPTRPEPDDYDDDDAPRLRHRRDTRKRAVRTPSSREALIAGIAEAMLIERALPGLLDPTSHAVSVMISRVGAMQADGLIQVTQVFAHQPAWFESGAHADPNGDIGELVIGVGKKPTTYAEWQQFWRGRRDVCIALRGLFVREALSADHGTWMVRAAAAEPDVLRVEIRPDARPAADVLKEHLAKRREFDRVMEHGGTLPENPDLLLPVTRTINFRAPLRSGEPMWVEIEDFPTGWVDRGNVKDIPLAVRRAWHLAWSRRGA